jgi:hypothetical protein
MVFNKKDAAATAVATILIALLGHIGTAGAAENEVFVTIASGRSGRL